MGEPKLTVSVAEAAQMLGIAKPKMYELTHRADFPAFRLGRRVLISVEGLQEWTRQQAGGEQYDPLQ